MPLFNQALFGVVVVTINTASCVARALQLAANSARFNRDIAKIISSVIKRTKSWVVGRDHIHERIAASIC